MFFRSQRYVEQSRINHYKQRSDEEVAINGLTASLRPFDEVIAELTGQIDKLPHGEERLWLTEDLARIGKLLDGTIVKQRGGYGRFGEFVPVLPEMVEEWTFVLNSTQKVLDSQLA